MGAERCPTYDESQRVAERGLCPDQPGFVSLLDITKIEMTSRFHNHIKMIVIKLSPPQPTR